ncbi:MAG: heme utilization protein HutZ [Candidatus Marinimicrobia bacterium]|nr:heme utilization protein HutZ [Candidatus Neomarinimicrobiota bacterium]|tara:strand:- start:7939 stop:8448 length:510 start_codon:yes stop_codon:yes gene_type:complete
MNEVIKEKNNLINNMSSLILGTTNNKNLPNSSYAPFGIDNENNFYIFISELSKHTKNIMLNPNVSLMIIEDESKSKTIFARKRLTITGKASIINRNEKDWNQKIKILENKFDDTFTYLKNMEDFHLFKITPISGLLVFGFAKAFNLEGPELVNVVHLNEKGHRPKKEKQ